ncbi:chitotriosidase-1 [Biomphalaria glabrata]|nr:chitotriosidase-1-like [Biomphalaria glabrata]
MKLLLMFVQLLALTFGKHIFCYYSSFAQTRKGVGKFLPEDINPHLCTHLIYAFVHITSDGRGLRPFNKNDLGQNGLYARTLALKKANPSLKVLLAVGGWQIGSKPFLPMIKTEETRATWIRNVIKYIRKRGFDGLDMDWEFPATRGSPSEDKYRFTALMKGLYEAFQKESEETGREKLLLTLATASGTYYIDQSYEPYKIINYIDFMLLMTYNYHGQWEKKTGHHSGLYPHKDDPKYGEKSQLYQEWSIDYWLSAGISKDKLIVGIPTYGMTFTLADASKHGVHAPAIGGGEMGQYTKESGILAYYEVCMNLRDKGWKQEWIDDQMVSYAYSGHQWVGYEDRRSMAFKAANIMKRDVGGAFVWSVEMDDFNGACGQGQYPLLSTLVDALGHGPVSQTAARERVTPLLTDQRNREEILVRLNTTPEPSGMSLSKGVSNSKTRSSPSPDQVKVPEVILNYSIIRKNKNGPLNKPSATSRQHRLKNVEIISSTESFSTSLRPTQAPGWLHQIGLQEMLSAETVEEKGHQNTSPEMPKSKPVIKLQESSALLQHKTKNLIHGTPYWIKPALTETTELPITEQPVVDSSKYSNKGAQSKVWWARPYPIDRSKAKTKSASGAQRGQSSHTMWWKQEEARQSQNYAVYIASPHSRNEVKVKALELPAKDGYYVISSLNNRNHRWWAAGHPSHQIQNGDGANQGGSGDKANDFWSGRRSTPPGLMVARSQQMIMSNKSVLVRQEVCRERGVGTFADPLSCDHFIMCLPGNWMDFPPPVMACPAGTKFDSRLNVCNYASDVTCPH